MFSLYAMFQLEIQRTLRASIFAVIFSCLLAAFIDFFCYCLLAMFVYFKNLNWLMIVATVAANMDNSAGSYQFAYVAFLLNYVAYDLMGLEKNY